MLGRAHEEVWSKITAASTTGVQLRPASGHVDVIILTSLGLTCQWGSAPGREVCQVKEARS